LSDKFGKKGHSGRGGSEDDVMAMFFTQEALDRFNLSKEEAELLNDKKKEGDKDKTEDEKKKEPEKVVDKTIKIDMKGLENRLKRLTINSSNLSDAVITSNGETLYYLSKTEDGHVLWSHKFLDKETKEVAKFKGGGSIELTPDEKYLFVFSQGSINRIEEKTGQKLN
jgi:hypothetical protein